MVPPWFTGTLAPLRCLASIAKNPIAARVLVSHSAFNPAAQNGMQQQMSHLFGPFICICADEKSPYFATAKAQQQTQVVSTLQKDLSIMQKTIAEILNSILRSGPAARDAALDWLGDIVRANEARRKMAYNVRAVSSDSYLINFAGILLELVQPIMASAPERVRDVDPRFVLQSTDAKGGGLGPNGRRARIDYASCTRLFKTAAEILKMGAEVSRAPGGTKPAFNLATELIFITLEVLHVGFNRCLLHYGKIVKDKTAVQEAVDSMGGENSGNPLAFAPRAHLQRLRAREAAMRTHLLDRKLLTKVFSMYNWTARWILHVRNTAPGVLAALPEYVVQDIVNFYILMNRFQPILLRSQPIADVVRAVVVLAKPGVVRNTHLRGQLPDVIALALPVGGMPSTDHIYLAEPFFQRELAPVLVDLFVDVERGKNQFYTKFHTRNSIASVFKFLLGHSPHRDALKAYPAEKFTQFVNLLCNDTVWLLDEGTKQLKEVLQEIISMQVRHPLYSFHIFFFSACFSALFLKHDSRCAAHVQSPHYSRIPYFQRQRREEALNHAQRAARTKNNWCLASVQLVAALSQWHAGPFVSKELVGRVAEMVNYLISRLQGGCKALKALILQVRNPIKTGFRPTLMLRELVRIFTIFSAEPRFVDAVARDERSFDAKTFTAAQESLAGGATAERRKFIEAIDRAEKLKKSLESEDDALGEIPTRFLDPIMQTLMSDPVRLPQSNAVVDRSVIQRHLLNSATDPFSRSTLSASQLIEQPKLRAEIDAFVAKRKALAANKARAGGDSKAAGDAKTNGAEAGDAKTDDAEAGDAKEVGSG